jgi:subtilisin family serine protease
VAAAEQLANQHGVRTAGVYQHSIHGFAFSGSAQAAQALARNPRIACVEPDRIGQAWEAQLPTGIQRVGIDQEVLSKILQDGPMVDARIAIIDTGLQRNHPDLNVDPNGTHFHLGRGHKIVSDGVWDDDHGHGTHGGGIAAANGAIVGVAPGARLTAVKVLASNGSAPYSVMIAGVHWVAANAANFDVANMSLGGGFLFAMNAAVKAATEAGAALCVAAGNSRADVRNDSPASARRLANRTSGMSRRTWCWRWPSIGCSKPPRPVPRWPKVSRSSERSYRSLKAGSLAAIGSTGSLRTPSGAKPKR